MHGNHFNHNFFILFLSLFSRPDDDSCPSAKDVSFMGFSEGFKGFSSSFKGFKEPPVPPAKTPFKKPEKTPRKTTKTPAKSVVTSQTLTRTPAKTPSKSVKTPAKRNRKTPTKTPAKARNDSSQSSDDGDVEMALNTPSSERVTRSSRKRKIQDN